MKNVTGKYLKFDNYLKYKTNSQKYYDLEYIHIYGTSAGHVVSLAQEYTEDLGLFYNIVLKSLDGPDYIVAKFLKSPENRIYADIAAMAALRSIRVIF